MVYDIISSVANRPDYAKSCTMNNQIQQTSAPLQKQHWSWLGLHNYIKILIIGILFCYLFRDEIQTIIHRWLTDSSWSHGFLIPMFSLYFINQHKEDILRSVRNNELKPNDLINVGTHPTSRWRAILRNAFRATYGFGFVYDRNFADRDFGTSRPFPGWF